MINIFFKSNKVLILLLLLSSCKKSKQEELITILTNDSMSMWNVTMRTHIELKDTTYYHDYLKSFVFTKDFISNTSKVDYFSINYNYIKIPSEVLFQIQDGYLKHPDYKQ